MATRGYASVNGFNKIGEAILRPDMCAAEVILRAKRNGVSVEIREVKRQKQPKLKIVGRPKPGKRHPQYNVTTWDIDKQMFTPQKGVRKGPYSKWGLRKALRALREMGYDTSTGGGHSVMVERYE